MTITYACCNSRRNLLTSMMVCFLKVTNVTNVASFPLLNISRRHDCPSESRVWSDYFASHNSRWSPSSLLNLLEVILMLLLSQLCHWHTANFCSSDISAANLQQQWDLYVARDINACPNFFWRISTITHPFVPFSLQIFDFSNQDSSIIFMFCVLPGCVPA